MKFILYIPWVLWVFTFYSTVFSADLKAQILWDSWSWVLSSTSTATWEWLLDGILLFVRDSIFGLLALVAIAVFLYIWAKLVVARGNPEEFKKALQSFIYAVVGLFVVAFAFALVRLVAGINI